MQADRDKVVLDLARKIAEILRQHKNSVEATAALEVARSLFAISSFASLQERSSAASAHPEFAEATR